MNDKRIVRNLWSQGHGENTTRETGFTGEGRETVLRGVKFLGGFYGLKDVSGKLKDSTILKGDDQINRVWG